MFFVDLPSASERQEIFEVHLKKQRPETFNTFPLPLLSELAKDFSGAEIEQTVIEAMRIGFNADREFTNEDLVLSIKNLVPLARTKSKEIQALIDWSKAGNVTQASRK